MTTPDYASIQTKTADPHQPAWMKRVPLITGGLAALAGYLTVHGADLSSYAIYHSNQAVLFQSQASDKWAEYQADSTKKNEVDVALYNPQLTPEGRKSLEARRDDFASRQPQIKLDAQAFERQRDGERTGGTSLLFEKDMTDYAGMAAQLGIAMASVAALTRRREAFGAGVLAGLVGVALTAFTLAVHYLHHVK